MQGEKELVNWPHDSFKTYTVIEERKFKVQLVVMHGLGSHSRQVLQVQTIVSPESLRYPFHISNSSRLDRYFLFRHSFKRVKALGKNVHFLHPWDIIMVPAVSSILLGCVERGAVLTVFNGMICLCCKLQSLHFLWTHKPTLFARILKVQIVPLSGYN